MSEDDHQQTVLAQDASGAGLPHHKSIPEQLLFSAQQNPSKEGKMGFPSSISLTQTGPSLLFVPVGIPSTAILDTGSTLILVSRTLWRK